MILVIATTMAGAWQKNKAEAVKWYQKAAEQGDTDAQFALGKCYYYGNGTEVNYETAARWIQKAAEQGNADAQNLLW